MEVQGLERLAQPKLSWLRALLPPPYSAVPLLKRRTKELLRAVRSKKR